MINMQNKIIQKGFSLFEMLVVITVFSLLAVLVTQSMAYSIKGSKKSENIAKMRSSLNYTLDLMERDIRSASSCTDNSGESITITDENDKQITYRCLTSSGRAWIASASSSLTADFIDLETCQISCISPQLNLTPGSVHIVIEAINVDTTSETLNFDTTITLRNRPKY